MSQPLTEPVLRMPVANDPNVSVQVWIKAGSMNDPAGKEGLALLTATMLSEGGTTKLPYDKILTALYPMAAGYGVNVDKEMIVFEGYTHRDHATAFARYFVDALVWPRFDPADFERIRASLTSHLENTLRFSSDEELGKAALYQSIFAGTRYAHDAHGGIKALAAITVDDVRAFWKATVTRDNIVVAIGGGYDEAFEKSIVSGLGLLGSGKPAPLQVAPAPLSGRRASRSCRRTATRPRSRLASPSICAAAAASSTRCGLPTRGSASTATRRATCSRSSARRAA